MSPVKCMMLFVFIGCIYNKQAKANNTNKRSDQKTRATNFCNLLGLAKLIDGIGVNDGHYLNHLYQLKKPLDKLVPRVDKLTKTWIDKIKDSITKVKYDVKRYNAAMHANFKRIHQKFKDELLRLHHLGISNQRIIDATNKWTQIKDDLQKRLNDCLQQQMGAMNDLSKSVEDFHRSFGEKLGGAKGCIEAFIRDKSKDSSRTRGHYKKMYDDCVEEAVTSGIELYESRRKDLQRRIKHTADAHQTISFCYRKDIVKDLEKGSDALVDSLKS